MSLNENEYRDICNHLGDKAAKVIVDGAQAVTKGGADEISISVSSALAVYAKLRILTLATAGGAEGLRGDASQEEASAVLAEVIDKLDYVLKGALESEMKNVLAIISDCDRELSNAK